MSLHCPKCGKSFDKEVFPLGEKVACPFCRETFNIAGQKTVPYENGEPGNKEGASPEPPPSEEGPLESAPEPAPDAAADEPAPEPEATNPTVTVNVEVEPGPGKDLDPGDRLGGFLLKEEIGRGGMGIVFAGVQESLNRKVAVKVLPSELSNDNQFVGRFEREAKSLANLSHPNIVGVIDKGFEKGHYYFVMEFVEGVSLRDLIDRGEMTPEKALALVPPLCDALEYAHTQGVVHRDIKPGNILIDDKGRIKIADFGLARIVRGDRMEDGLTRTNIVMGTPDYMAPEQRENPKSVDHRADIYSLGVVIYEMLTGTLPLGRFDPPSRSVGKNVRIDVRLDEVVLRALEKDRERRFQRASEVASAITEIQPGPEPAP
ncbi:MAG: protein kinase domain-containing protein, partial [Planctomycetota bacterium]